MDEKKDRKIDEWSEEKEGWRNRRRKGGIIGGGEGRMGR